LDKFLLKTAIFYYSSLINGISVFSGSLAAKIAMDVFQTPRGKKLSAKQKEFLETHQKATFNHKNESIPYYNWPAEGQKVLMLHGWESNSFRWKPYLKDLKNLNINVFAVDAPAHGRSNGKRFSPTEYAAVIKEVVAREKIETIVAHSVGAYATIIYASENETPQYLKNLVLLAPTGKLRDFMKQFFDFLKLNTKVRSAFEENFKAKYGQTLDYYDSDNLIKHVSIGGILVHDKEDATLPFSDSVEVAKAWRQGKFIPTEGYGHRLKGSFIKEIILGYLGGD